MLIDRVRSDVERALRAHRPDDADRILREIEVWHALSGRWHTARFDPGGPLSIPISPGTCVEAVRAAALVAFPDRAAAITAAVARGLWPTGLRPQGGSFIEPFRRQEAIVAEPDRFPSLAVLGPPESAREQLRMVLDLGSEPTEPGLQPVVIPFTFRLEKDRVVVGGVGGGRLPRVNGTLAAPDVPLAEGDVISGEYSPQLLFLDRVRA